MNKTMRFQQLKQFYSDRFFKKYFTRHFRRLAILEMFHGVPVSGEVPVELARSLTEAAFLEPEVLLS